MAADQKDLDDLVALLDLEQIELDIFRGLSPKEEAQRVFGGQVAGQALVAAGRTVDPERRVHSLHAYFLRPGDPTIPIVYDVDRIRDGRSFTTRRVVAIQHGRAIFNLSASFHITEPGFEHQAPMPATPSPEEVPPYREDDEWFHHRPIDLRVIDTAVPPDPDAVQRSVQRAWFRADGRLPDDPLLHVCVVAYASDMTLLDSVLQAQGARWDAPDVMGASLDHAMWFHRPFRADEWLLYDQESPSASGARGLATGRIFRADGTLVISVVQEGLLRQVPPP